MPYHVKTPSIMSQIVGDVYYKGDNRWTAIYDDRKIYEHEYQAREDISEYVVKSNVSYHSNHFANATIISE